jgi:hypothetical protein
VNARRSPGWILSSHAKDQSTNLLAHQSSHPTALALETHVQYNRKPARCQRTTVLGVTKMRGFVHPDQNIFNVIQNNLCRAVNRRRGRLVCRVDLMVWTRPDN